MNFGFEIHVLAKSWNVLFIFVLCLILSVRIIFILERIRNFVKKFIHFLVYNMRQVYTRRTSASDFLFMYLKFGHIFY
jgi:hypothetical protein